MNLESQIVIFSCNQRTVKNCPANFRRKNLWQNAKETVTEQKKLYIQNTSGKTVIIKTPFFGCCFLTGKICSLFTMQSIRVIIKPGRFEIVTLENAIYMGIKTIWHLSWIRICICMNISRPTTLICHFEIYFIFAVNTRNSWIKITVFFHLTENSCPKFYRILQWFNGNF